MLIAMMTLMAFLCTFIWLQASRHVFEVALDARADARDMRMRSVVDWKQVSNQRQPKAKRRFPF